VTLRGAAFDLDDTLFPERMYVVSGFAAVASQIANVCAIKPDDILRELLAVEAAGSQGRVFNTWLHRRDQLSRHLTAGRLVDIYRSHRPNISLFPGILHMLESLRKAAYRLAIVSDGPVQSQRAKVEALGLEHLVDRIVLTDEWGSDFWKPHHRAFELLETDWSSSASELVYIGDNPRKDFAGPKARGWLTIRLRFDGQRLLGLEPANVDSSAQIDLNSVEELSSFLLGHGP
jgi:putative hydrolase of the HAD superfamily